MALVQQDSKQIKILIEKIDKVIDQLQSCVNNVSAILKIHESKLGSQDKLFENFLKMVEARRLEETENQRLLHQRISSTEKLLDKKIDDTKEITDTNLHNCEEEIDARIVRLEKSKWMAIGALFVVSFIISFVINLLMNLDKVLNLFN